jgi:hypothetical protein
MKYFGLSAFLILISVSASAQDTLDYTVSILIGTEAPVVYGNSVEFESQSTIEIDETFSVEIVSPNLASGTPVILTRLLKKDGEEHQVLHASTQEFANQRHRDVGYRICGDQVTFISPVAGNLANLGSCEG